jgi:hypothetical protein
MYDLKLPWRFMIKSRATSGLRELKLADLSGTIPATIIRACDIRRPDHRQLYFSDMASAREEFVKIKTMFYCARACND